MKPIIVTVASLNWHGFYKVTGPHQTVITGCSAVHRNADKNLWALANGLKTLPHAIISRVVWGAIYGDKKLPIVIRTTSPSLIRTCQELLNLDEAPCQSMEHLHYQLKKFIPAFDLVTVEHPEIVAVTKWYEGAVIEA